ncbi:hypothetical protein FY048_12545 [Acinetobacter sp. 1124_18A]|uniref:hypothetical protein n=1 Tax=Acinetobacter sp. 1124_18A TaxID=2605958 RepID=UPI004057D3AB
MEEQAKKEAELNSENLKFLYEYLSKQYEHVKTQTVRLDDKATKYLTFVTIVMATIGIISRYYFFEISSYSFISTLPIIFLCISFFLILHISRYLLLVLKVTDVNKFSATSQMNSYIKTNNIDVIYEGLSDDLSTIIESYERSLANKKKKLEKSYRATSILGVILILLLFSIIIDLSTRGVKPSKSITTTCIIDLSKKNVEHNTTKAATTTCSTTTR